MLDHPFRYLPGENVWRFDLPDKTEVIVGGNAEAPDSIHLELAELVIQNIDAVVVKAKAYLGTFISFRQLASTGEWNPGSIEVGRLVDGPCGEFVLTLELDNDPYGLWSVGFRQGPGEGPNGLHPFFFLDASGKWVMR